MSLFTVSKEPGSSVSIVSDYGLDDRAIFRSPAGTKDFSSSLCAQTDSGAHPASCTMDIGGPFPGAKRGRGVTLTTHPHLVSKSRMSRSYISSPQAPPWRGAGLLCFVHSQWQTRQRDAGRKLLMGHSDIVAARAAFLRTVHEIRRNDKARTYYFDRTWVI
jgi:hypothetical protein